ncbi:MAG: prolyl oligopeptidase family serine peptidase [Gemmatimonadota bacterium]
MMTTATRLAPAALLIALAAAPGSAQAPEADARGPTSFTVDDAIDMTRVADPRLSPDGSRVIYTRRELDWGENERPARLWIADVDGGDVRPFTGEEGDGHARWSPDGGRVAFLRSVGEGDDRTRQVHVLRLDGGEAVQLTEHPTSVSSFEWTPDGGRIVFEADDTLATEEREAREKGYDAYLVDEGPNGQGPGDWSNLWIIDADPATDAEGARPVTEGERMIGDFAVSPDGERVAFTFRTEDHRNDGYRSEVAVVEIESGEVRQLTDNAAPESGLRWAPDGRRLAFTAPDLESWRLDQGNLYVMDLSDGSVRRLAGSFDGDMRGYEWGPDGRTIELVALERTISNLYRLDVASDAVERVSSLEGVVSSAHWSRDHDRVAFVFASPTSPGDIFSAAYPEGDTVRVSDANPELRGRELSEPEVVRWRSADGLEIEGLLYRPSAAAGPGAFILEIHGGPAGVFTRGFDSDAQILAAHGYAVLQPNVRGSTGYGDALLRGNMRDIGGGDYDDLMTGVDAMIERGVAHPDSLAVKGWSYGGILGGWTITRTERFRAASLGAMVADWRSEYGAGFHFDVVRWYIGGDPWTERERWIEMSSYTYVDRIETPTILFHGENDRTDTIEQTLNFHAGLRRFGVPTRFVRFPREGHGIGEPRHARTRLIEELRWFQRWVRGDEDWSAPERETDAADETVADGRDDSA